MRPWPPSRTLTCRALRVLALSAACLLPACSVDQRKDVQTWERELWPQQQRPQVQAPAPSETLSLNLAMSLAEQQNERLALAGENYLQAIIARRRIAAEFFPTLSFSPNYFIRERGGNTNPDFQTDRHLDAPFTAELLALNAPQSLAGMRASRHVIEQRRQLLLDARASLLLDVAAVYYQVLRSEAQARVLASSLTVQNERVKDVEAQREAGSARPLDVAQARAQAAATSASLAQARGDIRTGRQVLAYLLGEPAVDHSLQDDLEVPPQAQSLEDLELVALSQRADLLAAQAAVLAARESVEAAFAQHYPSVSLNLNAWVYKESIPAESIASAFVQLNVPIFTAGRIHQDVRAAWSRFRQAKYLEVSLFRQIRQDVRVAQENLQTSQARLSDLRENVRSAQEAVDQATDLFRVGGATNLERLVAQDQLLTAQLALEQELLNRKLAYLRLQRSTQSLAVK